MSDLDVVREAAQQCESLSEYIGISGARKRRALARLVLAMLDAKGSHEWYHEKPAAIAKCAREIQESK